MVTPMSDDFPPDFTAASLCDALGRKDLARHLGLGVTSVSNAVAAGVFPASWYLVVRFLCDCSGIECPNYLFKFLSPQHGDRND